MTEREPAEAPYWHLDEAIGEVVLWGEPWTLRVSAHVADEAYGRGGQTELVPLTADRGTRTWVQARAYILVPDIQLTVAVAPATDAGPLGTVEAQHWDGMKAERIGEAQAWYYHEDRLLILWECFLEDRYQTGEAPEDATLQALWSGFEHFLLARFPDTSQLITTADDPLYDTTNYQRFLTTLGYHPLTQRAFSKRRL